MASKWTEDEDVYIKRHRGEQYSVLTKKLNELFGNNRTVRAVQWRARYNLGLRRTQKRTNTQSTLCWSCQRALPKEINGIICPWVQSFEPIEGWDAEATTIGLGNMQTQSYSVRECPLYIKD